MLFKKRSRLPLAGLVFCVGALAVFAARHVRQSNLDQSLSLAVSNQDVGETLALLAAGADPNTRYHAEDIVSSPQRVSESLERVLQGKPPNDPTSPPVILVAFKAPLDYRFDYRLRKRTRYEATVLAQAMAERKTRHLILVKALLDYGADPNPAQADWSPLGSAAIYDDTDVVELLLQHGAKVNTAGSDHSTPLMMVARYGHAKLAARMLAAGADPNAADNSGRTVLMEAVRSHNLATVSEILKHCSNVNAVDENKQTALAQALRWHFDQIAQLLRSKGSVP